MDQKQEELQWGVIKRHDRERMRSVAIEITSAITTRK
jgi:hypothetical protein